MGVNVQRITKKMALGVGFESRLYINGEVQSSVGCQGKVGCVGVGRHVCGVERVGSLGGACVVFGKCVASRTVAFARMRPPVGRDPVSVGDFT